MQFCLQGQENGIKPQLWLTNLLKLVKLHGLYQTQHSINRPGEKKNPTHSYVWCGTNLTWAYINVTSCGHKLWGQNLCLCHSQKYWWQAASDQCHRRTAQVVEKPGVTSTYLLTNSSERAIPPFLGGKNNKKPIPGDGLQRSSELKRTYIFFWMLKHGPKHWSCDWRTWQGHAWELLYWERIWRGFGQWFKKSAWRLHCSRWYRYPPKAQNLFDS